MGPTGQYRSGSLVANPVTTRLRTTNQRSLHKAGGGNAAVGPSCIIPDLGIRVVDNPLLETIVTCG